MALALLENVKAGEIEALEDLYTRASINDMEIILGRWMVNYRQKIEGRHADDRTD
jgi:hypothetical protein